MGNEDLKKVVVEAFLIALDEKLDKRNTLSKDQIDTEKEEFERGGLDPEEAKKGRGVTLKNLKGVGNTDTEDVKPGLSKFGNLRKWARTMGDANQRGPERRRRVYNQVKSDTDDPSIIATHGKGKDKKRDVVAGNTRLSLRRALGKPLKAHIFKSSKPAPRAYEQIKNAVLNYLNEGRPKH